MEIAIGNREDAIRALKGELQYLGAGSFRNVFLSPDNQVVYKVCNDIPKCQSDCNYEELDNYIEMRDRGYRCIAITSSYVIGAHRVNAQPYYNGPRNEKAEADLIAMLRGTIYDIDFGGNVCFDKEGMPVVTDLQFYDPEGKGRMICKVA